MGLVNFVTSRLRENPRGCASFGNDRALEDRVVAERKRVVQELRDTLLQGFLAVSMHLHATVDQLPDHSASRSQLHEILQLVDRTLDEGRRALDGLRTPSSPGSSLGEALA